MPLDPCPGSPNCVSSDETGAAHAVAPFVPAVPMAEAWAAVRRTVTGLPRTRIVHEHAGYLHAECRSMLFRFVDDLELEARPESASIAVRSASRLGWSDLGVNRRRVERLRARLTATGVLRRANP